MKGHRRRESAAQGRGASRQSQVHHNSCASEARRSSTPKHPNALSTLGLLVRGGRRTTERENKRYRSKQQSQA